VVEYLSFQEFYQTLVQVLTPIVLALRYEGVEPKRICKVLILNKRRKIMLGIGFGKRRHCSEPSRQYNQVISNRRVK